MEFKVNGISKLTWSTVTRCIFNGWSKNRFSHRNSLSGKTKNPLVGCWNPISWFVETQWPPITINIGDCLFVNYVVVKDTFRSIRAGDNLYFMTWWTRSSHIEVKIKQYHSILASLLLVFLSAWTISCSCLTTLTAIWPRCPIITAFLNVATSLFSEWLAKIIWIVCTCSCSCLAASITCSRTIWPWAPIT